MNRLSQQDIEGLDRFWNRVAVTPPSPQQGRDMTWFGAYYAGVTVTPEIALEVSAVWACIDVITKAMSAQPWNIYKRLPNGDRDLLFNDGVGYLLNCRANSEMSAISCREALNMGALAWGNGYAEIVRDDQNRVVGLYPISPDRVQMYRREDGTLIYRVANIYNAPVELEPWQIIHIHGIGLTGLVGDNVISRAAHTVALALAAERFAESYFANNTEVGGTLEYPNAMDDQTYDRVKDQWEKRYKGPNRGFRPAILEGGMKWTPANTNASNSQLIETRKNQVVEIARWFGVPPHKIGDLDRSTNNNIEHQGLEFVRDALTPWARRNEQEVDFKLLSGRGPQRFSKIDLEPLSQGDASSRATYYSTMRNIGVYSANDILIMEGKNTIGPEGDIRLVNGTSIKLQDVGLNYKNTGIPSDPPSDPDPQPAPEAPPTGDSAVKAAFLTVFNSVFDRVEKRRAARRADLERARKSGDDIDSAMSTFAAQHEAFLHDNLAQPSATAGEIAQRDVFALALSGGRAVAAGEIPAAKAAQDLVDLIFGAKQ